MERPKLNDVVVMERHLENLRSHKRGDQALKVEIEQTKYILFLESKLQSQESELEDLRNYRENAPTYQDVINDYHSGRG